MKIYFRQTGGIAGMRLSATLDTETLPPGKARALEKLVARAHFFDLPSKIPPPGPGADRFQYVITVESGRRCHTVELIDGAIPKALEPLLQALREAARPDPAPPARER